jgi:shikimate dehydrogenase
MAMLGQLSGATRLFPIIGDPVKYVESPMRLTRTFEERDYNGICVPMQVAADDLDAVMAGLTAARNVDGILVTMPHKFTAFAHCATSSERAKMLGVVSVIRRNPDGTWHGDMLDGLAFVKAQKDHGAEPEGARVLLVGAGGAGSAIAIALLEAGGRRTHHPRCRPVTGCDTHRPALGPRPRAGECRAAGSHRLRSGVQRDSHGHGRG